MNIMIEEKLSPEGGEGMGVKGVGGGDIVILARCKFHFSHENLV